MDATQMLVLPNRVIYVCSSQEQQKLQVIQIYPPTRNCDDEEAEELCKDITKANNMEKT